MVRDHWPAVARRKFRHGAPKRQVGFFEMWLPFVYVSFNLWFVGCFLLRRCSTLGRHGVSRVLDRAQAVKGVYALNQCNLGMNGLGVDRGQR